MFWVPPNISTSPDMVRKIGNLICLGHLFRSRAVSNWIFSLWKPLFSFMRAQFVLSYHLMPWCLEELYKLNKLFFAPNRKLHSLRHMILILDGSSERGAHIWSEWGISICCRHLVTSKDSLNLIFFLGKYHFLHHTCATFSEQTSDIKTMLWPEGAGSALRRDTSSTIE